MYQIDGPDAVLVKPAKKPAESAPGWFDGGDPVNAKKATTVTRDWLNMIQAELANVVEAGGLALDRSDDGQLLKAIKALVVAVVNSSPEIRIETVPVGTVIAYHGETAPGGYLACDGSPYSVSAYPRLYAVLGTATLPDLRGCFVRGVGGKSGGLGETQQDAGRDLTGSFEASDDMGVGQWYGCFYVSGNWGGSSAGGPGQEKTV